MNPRPKLEKSSIKLAALLKELIKDNLSTVSVTRKETAIYCQMFQNFPISKYNQIYLQLKESISCIESNELEELIKLQGDLIANCETLLNSLIVGNGQTGYTMANILVEVKHMAILVIRNVLKVETVGDYRSAIGLSKIRRLHLSETSTDWEGYFLPFDVD